MIEKVEIDRDELKRLQADSLTFRALMGGNEVEGFKLVPVEPTDGCRVEAGFEVIDRKHIPTVTIKMPPISAEDSKGWDRRDKVAQAIRAMLAAAPKGDSHE